MTIRQGVAASDISAVAVTVDSLTCLSSVVEWFANLRSGLGLAFVSRLVFARRRGDR